MSNVPLTLVIFSLLLYSGGTIGITPVSPASGQGTAFAQERGLSKVTFKVKCYDEGRAALRGLQRIQEVESGFHYLHEVNTAYYDPKMITIDEMETALKKAGTYVATITEKERN
jgi:hypothetical protein